MPDKPRQRITSISYDATNLAVSSNFFPSYQLLPEVSRHTRRASNEVHDTYDPETLTTFARQRQQHFEPRPSSSHSVDRPTSAAGSQRTLRRARRQDGTQLPHRRAFSLDHTPRQPANPPPSHLNPSSAQRASDRAVAALHPAYSEVHTDENGSTIDDPYQLLNSSYWPWRTTRVSSRTASAILFALEEAIRRPIPFTTDWDEVNASMSDMVGVAGPAGPMGNGRVQNGAPRAPPAPTTAPPQPPSGMRTPTDIMRQRRDREARRKAEQEARDREKEELERQQLEQEQAAVIQAQARAQAHQQLSGGAGAAGARAQRPSRGPETQFNAPPPGMAPGSTPNFRATAPVQPGGRPDYGNPPHPASSQPQLGSSIPQGPPQSATVAGTGQPTGTSAFSKPAPAPVGQPGTSQTLQQQPQRVSFPHAFERWETLSSHWEGLTSYWVRKMEENKDDVEADPISKQLARQITDLSAAGANLFHAVVELQRLRASSERKFQRWFFDTRSEQERSKEVQADLERQLKAERQGRADAFAAAQTAEQDKARAEDLLREMRRELQISKEEARRAWEELGRREQEERERTNSLRNGEPTLVGGVQVVPMIQGVPSRHTTRPPTRDGPYTGAPTTGAEYQAKPTDQSASRGYYDDGGPTSPTGSDPFIEPRKPQPPAEPASSKATYTGDSYAHENTAAYPATSEPDDRSYVSSEPGDEYGFPTQDHPQAGRSYYQAHSEASDEYDQAQDEDRHYVTDGAYTSASTTAPVQAPHAPPTADYSGSDWGVGTGWESVTPRHRHPTRLSDVLEEDEPSRTSPSRASQASRSMH
ncbi:uncharacterized protein N7483_007626 [Penicillium malachiteum]|uniref:uncharacterized protein n=1 Tax=Penicillium malachiteum TaxID=1324776 RepID=UPI0025493DD7|nr:uncharacterized protein N7483_007626 [Penicillium malachiteum]KAJ5726269.1 hypothetical protein N7483_007626 [Penicillium malachiteum]